MIFSIDAYILYEMLQDITKQLEDLKLMNKKISKHVKTTHLPKEHSKGSKINSHQKPKTI